MILKKGKQKKRVSDYSKSFIKGLISVGWREVKDDSMDVDTIQKEAEEIANAVINATKKVVENIKEEVEEKSEDSIEEITELQRLYFEQEGKYPSNRYKYNAEWIKSKLK